MMSHIRDFYANTEQIASRFGVCSKTIKRWIKEEGFPAFQKTLKSPYMATEDDIQVWIPKFKKRCVQDKPR